MKKSILMLLTLTMFIVLFACGKDKENPIEPSKKVDIITSVPKAAFVGDNITIIGTNFGESHGTGFVFFAGTKATDYTSWSDNEIVVKVPEGAESGKLWLEVNGEKSNEVDFIVLILKKATITSINPQSVFINDTLTITGKYFGDSSKTNYISFSFMNLYNYLSWSDTLIKVKVYTGIRTGKLWLNINGEMSNKVDYTILFKIPNITSVIPQSAAIGDIVTITGTNLGESKGFSFVSFAGTNSMQYPSWNDNELKVKVPKDALSGKIWVEVESVKSNEMDFIIK